MDAVPLPEERASSQLLKIDARYKEAELVDHGPLVSSESVSVASLRSGCHGSHLLKRCRFIGREQRTQKGTESLFFLQPFAAMISFIAPNLRDPLGPWPGRQLASGEI